MKRVAPLFVALVLSVLLALVAYRVSVHYATFPVAESPATPDPAPRGRPPPLTREEMKSAKAPQSVEQAQAADALARARPIQAAVDAFYVAEGTWPRNLAQLGLGNPDSHAGGPVAAISVRPDGEVAVVVKPHVARGGEIRLLPDVRPDGSLEWTCRARNYPAATRLPECR